MEVINKASMEVAGSFHGRSFHGDGDSFHLSAQNVPWKLSLLPWKLEWENLPMKKIAIAMEAAKQLYMQGPANHVWLQAPRTRRKVKNLAEQIRVYLNLRQERTRSKFENTKEQVPGMMYSHTSRYEYCMFSNSYTDASYSEYSCGSIREYFWAYLLPHEYSEYEARPAADKGLVCARLVG